MPACCRYIGKGAVAIVAIEPVGIQGGAIRHFWPETDGRFRIVQVIGDQVKVEVSVVVIIKKVALCAEARICQPIGLRRLFKTGVPLYYPWLMYKRLVR